MAQTCIKTNEGGIMKYILAAIWWVIFCSIRFIINSLTFLITNFLEFIWHVDFKHFVSWKDIIEWYNNHLWEEEEYDNRYEKSEL